MRRSGRLSSIVAVGTSNDVQLKAKLRATDKLAATKVNDACNDIDGYDVNNIVKYVYNLQRHPRKHLWQANWFSLTWTQHSQHISNLKWHFLTFFKVINATLWHWATLAVLSLTLGLTLRLVRNQSDGVFVHGYDSLIFFVNANVIIGKLWWISES